MLAALVLAATTASATPSCKAAQLRGSVENTDGKYAGMSHNGGDLRLVNVSGAPCSIPAAPKLEFYKEGETPPLDIERDDSFGNPNARVTIPPGATAIGSIRWVHNNVFQGGACDTVASAGYVAGGDGKIVPLDLGDQFCGDAHGPRWDWQPLKVSTLPQIGYTRLNPSDYQAFVVNWNSAKAPLCAVLDSATRWSAVVHPAPVMGGRQTYGPPAAFWKTNAVLLVARVIPQGDTSNVFRLLSLAHDGTEATAVRYAFAPTPAASSSMKWWMALAVPKPVSPTIHFIENGRDVCTLRAGYNWRWPM